MFKGCLCACMTTCMNDSNIREQEFLFEISITEFRKQCLDAHNHYRYIHDARALQLSDALNEHAQMWADFLASKDTLVHNKDQRYGENLYRCRGFEPKGQFVCKDWYDEVSQYDFDLGRHKLGSGHFTAMVWYDTQRLGIGRARSKQGLVYVVANYDPPGNLKGAFSKNVWPSI